MRRVVFGFVTLALAIEVSGCGRRGSAATGAPPLSHHTCPDPYLRDPKNPCAPNYIAPLKKRHWANSL